MCCTLLCVGCGLMIFCLLFRMCCVLRGVVWLAVACCLTFVVVVCLVFAVCCVLFAVRCLLFGGRCCSLVVAG